MGSGTTSHGGARPGAGRPPSWEHSPTVAVKIPLPIKDQILAAARAIDQGHTVQVQGQLFAALDSTPDENVTQSSKVIDLAAADPPVKVYKLRGQDVVLIQDIERLGFTVITP